ncbi:MAG: Tic22 family protein [Cyanobacteria bacterium J06621_12]
MKISLIRKSITLGIASVTFLSLSMIENLIAIALPEAEVIEKLNPVPVFTIADEQGAPLVASCEDKAKVASVFVSRRDATVFVNQLKIENLELGEKLRVVPVSLGEIYKLAGSAGGDENALNFAYVPEEEAVTSAKTIGEENEQPYPGGVPLFVARAGEGKGYLTFERNSQQVIPFFFDKAQLEAMVARFKEQEPEVAANVDIQVYPLKKIIKALETSSDKILEKAVLVPSTESIEFLENIAVPSAVQIEPQPDPNSSISDTKSAIDVCESAPSRTVPRNNNIHLPPAYIIIPPPPPYIPPPAPCC